jgi:hypothetical protein
VQEVCQLAFAACKNLEDACSADVQQQQQQQQTPVPPLCLAAVGRFACACLRLANSVLVQPDFGSHLVESGCHAAAAEAAKAGVKHLVGALEALGSRHLGGGAPAQAAPDLQGALSAACELLLELALAATALVTGEGPPGAPRELVSLAVLNIGWNGLGRLMAAPAPAARAALPDVARRAAGAALRQLLRSARELRAPGQEGRLRLVRFWLGAALKALGASAAAARSLAWRPLVGAALRLHAMERAGFEEHEAVAAGAVRDLLLPKLAAAMLSALNEPGAQPSELRRCLEEVTAAADKRAAAASIGAGGCGEDGGAESGDEAGAGAEADPRLMRQAGVLLCADMLQSAPRMQPELAKAVAAVLLPWMLRSAGCGAADTVLAGHPGGLWRHVRCAALAFVLGCATGAPHLDGAWQEAMEVLQLLGGCAWSRAVYACCVQAGWLTGSLHPVILHCTRKHPRTQPPVDRAGAFAAFPFSTPFQRSTPTQWWRACPARFSAARCMHASRSRRRRC